MHNKQGSEALIRAEDISLRIGGRSILDRVSLQISAGEAVSLIGPNGAGKTTLVRILLGLMSAESGSVHRRTGLQIGYMPQKLEIEATLPLTVERFLQLPGRRMDREREAALDVVRIGHLRGQSMKSLSGGETQRVLLARALGQKPDLLVLDEPAQGVDVGGQTELYALINEIRQQQGCGVLMISHDLHLVMAQTDEVICLNHHICCHGKPEDVSHDPSYLELFGRKGAESLAVYTHRHNHQHGIDGDVLGKKHD